jgi:hypothetical protein
MPPRKKKTVSSMVAAFGILLASSSLIAAPLCQQVDLKKPPLWISNAAYLDAEQQLVFVDPFQNKLLAYTRSGAEAVLPDALARESLEPVAIARLGKTDYILESLDGTLVRFDKAFRQTETISPLQLKSAQGVHVGSMYQWKVAGNSTVIAFGALIDGGRIVTGFFRVPLGGTRAPEMLTAVSDTDFYLVGNSYITIIGDTAYYVVMSKEPTIYRVKPGEQAERLRVTLPKDLRERPEFTTRMTGPNSAKAHFAELEKFSVISGIYSQGNLLYVLARSTGDWFIHRLNPKDLDLTGAAARSVELSKGVKLPITAAHLTVVPAKSSWYFIERGTVKDGQRQDIARMDVIDSSALASGQALPSSCPR